MVNIITELEKRSKELLNEIEQLKAPLQFKQLNNEEIRAWIATVISESHYTDNPDVDIVDAIMERIHCYGETWSDFCKLFPTEVARRRVIFNAYQYYPYYKQSGVHWQVRNKAKRDIFINLIKLNSEESKELFRKWVREGKIEDNLTLKGILEKGYESWNSISVSCYNHYDLRYLSLDELISSWNELTVSADKKAANVSKLERAVEELKVKLVEQDNKIESLEDEVWMEREEAEKALDKSREWREQQMDEAKAEHFAREKLLLKQIEVLENNILWLKNKEQIIKKYEDKELPALPKQQKENRLWKFKHLVNKEKSKEKFQTFIIQRNK